jgi:hypothetical protein
MVAAALTGAAACAAERAVTMPNPGTAQPRARVIVTFRIETSAAGDALARGREALLGELPRQSYRVLRAYETIPAVALEVSPEALRILEKSPAVVSIEKDALVAPQ